MVICFKLETATIITEKSVDVFGVHLGVKLLASFSKSHSFLIELLFNLLSQIITISTIKLTCRPSPTDMKTAERGKIIVILIKN